MRWHLAVRPVDTWTYSIDCSRPAPAVQQTAPIHSKLIKLKRTWHILLPPKEISMKYPVHTTLRVLSLVFISALVTACVSGPPTPTVDYKADYNFNAVKTIAFYEDSGQVSGDNPLQISDMQRDRIDEALSHALEKKGFEIGKDTGKADLLLSWSLFTQEKTSVQTWNTPNVSYAGYYSRYNRYSGYNCWNCLANQTEVTVSNYTEGTFIVDLIDPTLKRSVWRSVIQSRLKGKIGTDQDKYNEAAAAIFASFPPGVSTPAQ